MSGDKWDRIGKVLNGIIAAGLIGSAILGYDIYRMRSAKAEAEEFTGLESTLTVNLSPEHKMAILSRAAGEKKLLDITLNADNEEAWIFIRYKNGHEFWFECGEYETANTVSDQYCLGYIIGSPEDELETASIYHIHPIKGSPIIGQLPSDSDIARAIHIDSIIREASPGIEKLLDHKIVVPTGIYTIKMKEQTVCRDESSSYLTEERISVNAMEILANDTESAKIAFEAGMLSQKPAFFFLNNYNVAYKLDNEFLCVRFKEDRKAAEKYIAQALMILVPLSQTK